MSAPSCAIGSGRGSRSPRRAACGCTSTPRPAGRAEAAAGAVDQIVDNLLDNALAVAPTGTAVDVAVRPLDRAVEVTIADRGPGMTPDTDRPLVRPLLARR